MPDQPPSPSPHSPVTPSLMLMLVVTVDDAESFGAFVARIRPASGVALIILPLTDQDHEACAARLREPGVVLPSVAATDGLPLLADRLHLLPAGSIVTVAEGRLRVTAIAAEGPVTAIDETLTSLAQSHGDRAVALLFAGAVAHIFSGISSFKESGGLVLVEGGAVDVDTADSEVALMADHVQPVAELAERFYEYVSYRGTLAIPPLPQPDELGRIVGLVGSQTGVDFSDYKKSTMQRRIQRRISINRLTDVASYIELLQQSAGEATTLYREMLIGVTRFFRDPEAFVSLTALVMKPLIAKHTRGDPLRVWVAGCATGEEAYSIAILLREAMGAAGLRIPVKIFATDLDRDAVHFASAAVYPAGIAADVNAERLERFFVPKNGGFQVAKAIREMVVFAHHNIVRDPPFFRMDLVTCRNLLIYLQPVLQRRLFNAFHFALVPDGHLMLGTSETLGEMAPYFTPVDGKWKIYRKKGERSPRISDSLVPDRLAHRPRPVAERTERPATPSESLQDLIQQSLLHELMPAFLIADGNFEIHYISGTVERYLALPRGKPTFNLAKMASRELAVALSTGIRRVLRDGGSVVFDDIAVQAGEGELKVRLSVRPLASRSDLGNLVVVIFEEPTRGERGAGQQFDITVQTDQRIKDLETELDQSKESLQAAIEELETANEELQATNEEVLAANEELQSTNEELQSVNEELYTVNAEHQAKITELTELNNDILNLLGSTNIGTVFLDQRLCVRKFTRAATEQINLIDKDIGRPLAHISNNIEYEHLVSDSEEVLRTLVPKQRKVCTRQGNWYLMRMLPYRTEDNIIKGVVITFIEISETKGAGEMIRRLSNLIENTALIAMITNVAGDIDYVNQRFVEVTGWTAEEALGRNPRFLASPERSPAVTAELWRCLQGPTRKWTGTFLNLKRNGEPYTEDAVVLAVPGDDDRVIAYLKLASVATSVEPASAPS